MIPPVRHLRVPDRETTEADHEFGAVGDLVPGGLGQLHLVPLRHDVGQDDLRGRRAVGVDRTGAATDQIQEPVELRLRVVKTSCARPAVGTAVDRLVAVLTHHPVELVGGEAERLVPAHLHEHVDTATFTTSLRATLQPSSAHRGTLDAERLDPIGQHLTDRRRIGIEIDGSNRLDPTVGRLDVVDAPLRCCPCHHPAADPRAVTGVRASSVGRPLRSGRPEFLGDEQTHATQFRELGVVQVAGAVVDHAERADTLTVIQRQRHPGVEPGTRFVGHHRIVREPRIGEGVGDLEHVVAENRMSAERDVAGRLGDLRAVVRLEPLTSGVDECDECDRDVEQFADPRRVPIESFLGRGVEDAE